MRGNRSPLTMVDHRNEWKGARVNPQADSMHFAVFPLGAFQANGYILGCPQTRQALVIDPGADAEQLAAWLSEHELVPAIYFHTHGHIDHVGATRALKERFGGEIWLHPDDRELYARADEIARAWGLTLAPPLPIDRFLSDGQELRWGEQTGRVVHTPGHSPGGVCLRVAGERLPAVGGSAGADWVFTGDTLFQGSIGRTDLPGGSLPALLRSIRERLLSLPDATVVAPGHGPLTTIGAERTDNPFLRGDLPRGDL